jgi:hypothetical protein
MKAQEIKVAEQLVNLTDDHWFNPAILARYLTDQPFHTVDRIMELVAQIIRWQANRHTDELDTEDGIYNSGMTSEGLFLANELNQTLNKLIKTYKWEKSTLELNFGLTNAYNRANVFYIDRVTSKRVDQLPMLPSIGLEMSF